MLLTTNCDGYEAVLSTHFLPVDGVAFYRGECSFANAEFNAFAQSYPGGASCVGAYMQKRTAQIAAERRTSEIVWAFVLQRGMAVVSRWLSESRH